MSQKPIPDFTETELWVVRTTLKERYGKDIPIELAEAEIMLGGEIGDAIVDGCRSKPTTCASKSRNSKNFRRRPATSLRHRTIPTIP